MDERVRGELRILDQAIASERSYYLVYPPRNTELPTLVAFRQWLLKACQHTA